MKRSIIKNVKYHYYNYHQYRCINQMFDYGNNKPQLLQFELSSYQYELHGEDSLFIHDNSAFGVADGGKFFISFL